MATIVVQRTSEYLNRIRNYGVYIDGKKVGTIANGETNEFSVSTGQHLIYTKIDWCSSRTLNFDSSDNEIRRFEVGGFKHGYWLMPTAIFIIILSYILNLKHDFEYLFYLAIPIFLLLVYYLTVGRKRYLNLTEIKSKPEIALL